MILAHLICGHRIVPAVVEKRQAVVITVKIDFR
jgi:hypothetical protein